MATSIIRVDGDVASTVSTLLAAGSVAHPFVQTLSAPRAPLRDLADAVHALCLLHGHSPGVIELAAGHANRTGSDWLHTAARAFAQERAVLARLAAAVGPLPSTAGQAETEATIIAQCHALAMLARSERLGCSRGAAAAVALDWAGVRRVLDNTAQRLGIELPPSELPADLGDVFADCTAPAARAAAFGFDQVLAQHRGLWNLLEVRVGARLDY